MASSKSRIPSWIVSGNNRLALVDIGCFSEFKKCQRSREGKEAPLEARPEEVALPRLLCYVVFGSKRERTLRQKLVRG